MDEKNQDLKPIKSLLVLEAICFTVWLAGIFFFYLPLPESTVAVSRAAGEENPVDLLSIMLSVILALIIFYWLRRKRAMAPVVAVLFGVVIYNTAVIFIARVVALLLAVLLVYLERAYRSFATNNFLVLAGVFAAAVSFATTFSLNFLLILLVCFSLYDIVGVFFVKAIPRVAKNAARIGIPLLLMVPKKMKDIFSVPTSDTTASLLGAGDLFIPLLFLMSVSVRVGWEIALVSFVGVVLGSLGNIVLVRKIKTGIPAVPLLAIGLAVGYGIGLLIFG
jgi:presenilin-like A22 family membrane protease